MSDDDEIFRDAMKSLGLPRKGSRATDADDGSSTEGGPEVAESPATAPARDGDDELFREAMSSLGLPRKGSRATDADDGLIGAMKKGASTDGAKPEVSPASSPSPNDPYAEADDAFASAMRALGEVGAPEATTDDSAEGERPHGTTRRLARRIRQGELREEASLDLHGMTRDQAHRALAAFLATSRRRGLAVVRIVSGRGLHSSSRAVLMEAVVPWLRRDFATHVSQVVKAPAAMGGEGAYYAILRRQE